MTIFFIVFGILLIICGFSCMFTPLITFIESGWFIVILLAVYGVLAIIRSVSRKNFGASFFFGILSVILAVVTLFFPGMMLLTDGILIYLAAGWFVVQGILASILAVKTRKLSKLWILKLILGIIAILLGAYSFFHPMLMAVSIGYLIGFYFIESGFMMILNSSAKK